MEKYASNAVHSVIEYTFVAWDESSKTAISHTINGIVTDEARGMSRLGNEGIRVIGCECGSDHWISRNAWVKVVREHAFI